MSEIKRYTQQTSFDGLNHRMFEFEDGEFVHYPDYTAALAAKDKEIERLIQERDEALAANERDRSDLADMVSALDKEIRSRKWLEDEGRGNYEWDDDRYKQEFYDAITAILEKIDPLRRIIRDLSQSPTKQEAVEKARKECRRELKDRIAVLGAKLARLSAPVTDEEWDEANTMPMAGVAWRHEVDAIIAARAAKETK